jgi:magnesium chelatase family protein
VPGEVTLSHKGVLFLDEFTELRRDVLESLREPLESKRISISRARMRLTYPCDFMLVAAMNPCPCGQRGVYSDDTKRHGSYKSLCECAPHMIHKYFKKISGPILDRLDIQLWIPQVPFRELREKQPEDVTEKLREGVSGARKIQSERFNTRLKLNAAMGSDEVRAYCALDHAAESLIDSASSKFSLSARAYTRILKLARTIADIEGSADITSGHVAEAISYRVDLASRLS